MSLSVNVALLGQQGVINSNSTQQSTAVRLSGLTVNSPASANEAPYGFGFGRGLLSAVFQAINQVQSDPGNGAAQGSASPASGTSAVSSAGSVGVASGTGSSAGAASSTSGSSAAAAPAGASDGSVRVGAWR